MTLLYPDSDIPFHPNPGWFLGAFNCYDREETLGETLNRYDPLDPAQLQALYDAYVFDEFGEQLGFIPFRIEVWSNSKQPNSLKLDYETWNCWKSA